MLLQIAFLTGRVLSLVSMVSHSRIALLSLTIQCSPSVVYGVSGCRGQFWDTITHLPCRKCSTPYHVAPHHTQCKCSTPYQTKPPATYRPVNVNGSLLGGVFWRQPLTTEKNRFLSSIIFPAYISSADWCTLQLCLLGCREIGFLGKSHLHVPL